MMNSLVGVLTRFSQEKIALAADIEAIFHQVRVREEDCDALRFLWWAGGDMTQTPKTYCMQVHLFGATSSPSCAAYALRRTASDNIDRFQPEVVSTVCRNFYVDDCLKSVASEKEAIKLGADLRSLTSLGGFRLTKWLSNSRYVLSAIPEFDRAPSVVSLEPGDLLPYDRALGVSWNVNDDKITFKVKLAEKPLTRRGILSVVSSIYDPLGLVSPVTLRAKAIVQNLCRKRIGWDDTVPQRECEEWQRWIANIPRLENISENRSFRPSHFGEIKNIQLHVFSDGSETGYGACAYLRVVDEHNKITCSLVLGKSRLAPIKNVSIPRLELSGAVVACRLYAMLSEELDLKLDHVVFWTDSTILLGYINNVTRRFKTFVGNRLSFIHEITSPEQWRYIDSGSNPADIASRGIDPGDEHSLGAWLNGPEYLLQDPSTWPVLPTLPLIADDDSEVKREFTVNTSAAYASIDALFNYYSDWTRLRRAVAWLRRFITYCKRHRLTHGEQLEKSDLTAAEIKNATFAVLRHVQTVNFNPEVTALSKGNPVKRESRIAALNPVLVDGLVRVYERQNQNEFETGPIILPKTHHVNELIIRHCHDINGHVGRQQVLAKTRGKYWILRGISAIKKVLGDCFARKRQHGPLLTQQMAPLIKEQTTPDKPPFTFVGIDYFGPLMVKDGTEFKEILFDNGSYSYQDINTYIHEVLSANGDTESISIEFDLSSFRCLLTIESPYLLDLRGSNFGSLIGFENEAFRETVWSTKIPNITNSVDYLYLHCDIASNSIVDGEYGDVIYVVSTADLRRSYLFTLEPLRVSYCEMNKTIINSIRLHITDPTGRLVNLNGIDTSFTLSIKEA